jgi:short-subunit dehydrogenase
MNILITGSSSGIGLEIFNELKKDKKNNFFLISRSKQKEINKKNIKHYSIDLSNLNLLKTKLKKILKDANNTVDLIICNAAQGVFGNLENISFNQYKKTMDINFFSHLMIIKSVIPLMKKKNYGHIVNISSGAGIVGLNKSSNYSASKSAMQVLIESISTELNKYNIHAKNIFPGPTKTNFFKQNIHLYKNSLINRGENVKKISQLIVKNLFKKKINIFCQKKTMASFVLKMFPNLL